MVLVRYSTDMPFFLLISATVGMAFNALQRVGLLDSTRISQCQTQR
jgi:hypothetical protein